MGFYFRLEREGGKDRCEGRGERFFLGFRGGKIGLNSILLVWFPFLEKDPIFLFLCVIFLLAFLLNAGQEGLGVRYPRPSY